MIYFYLQDILFDASNILNCLTRKIARVTFYLYSLIRVVYRKILRYNVSPVSRSADPATPTEPPGVPVNFGSLSPESRQRSIPRTSCFPNTLPSPTLLQISSATGLSRDVRMSLLISRQLMIALKLRLKSEKF